jgi:hypothetical protein
MIQETKITKIGTYKLYQYASVNNKAEFLNHLALKQNVVFVASLSDHAEMKKLCTSASLTTTPLNDGKHAHFKFSFHKLSDDILKNIFYSVINAYEENQKLPKYENTKVMSQISIDTGIININVWRVDKLPHFEIEIF